MQHLSLTQETRVFQQGYKARSHSFRLFHRFITWCHLQEKNRLVWLGFALLAAIGVIALIAWQVS